MPEPFGMEVPGDRAIRFFRDEAERDRYRWSLKERACPHCRAVGFVICHGCLRGYGLGQARVVRGYRFFCSNRHRKRGCGRTYSILLAGVMPRRYAPASLLSRFLTLMLVCASLRQAWRELDVPISYPTFARLWRGFAGQALEVRRRLTQLLAPPTIDTFSDNARLTVVHLQEAFAGHVCPVSSYQYRFQQPLIP